ncbi:MAG: VOC family protein [Actinomycetes bacterium]
MTVNVQVTFDAADPRRLGAFWRDLLGYTDQPPPAGYDSWSAWMDEHEMPPDMQDGWYSCVDPAGNGPRLYFQRVPEGKTAKNRVHLDVNVGQPRTDPSELQRQRVDAAVERAVGAGASVTRVLDDHGEYCVVMADPEANEFCLQ